MKRQPVSSSRLAEVGYDPDARMLEVAFTPNRDGFMTIWTYEDVGPQVAEQLLGASSIGREFNVIMAGGYRARRVGHVTPTGDEIRENLA